MALNDKTLHLLVPTYTYVKQCMIMIIVNDYNEHINYSQYGECEWFDDVY